MTSIMSIILCFSFVIMLHYDVTLGIDLDMLDSIMISEPEWLCETAKCISPMGAQSCPKGSRWLEGVTVGGCCGGCVQFKKEDDRYCTGKLDPSPCLAGSTVIEGPGYGYCTAITRRGSITKEKLSLNLTKSAKSQEQDVFSSSWCDLGLICTNAFDRDIPVCILNDNFVSCKDTQKLYDSDVENERFLIYRDDYRWRPECDENDDTYSPKQCKSSFQDSVQSCVCVDPSGNTLPGKGFDFQDKLYEDMNCLCSRRQYELQSEGVTGVTLHCQSNGNYEELQCQDGFCYCVHPNNGSTIGYQMPESGMNYLPCFNSTLIGDLYFRKCDSQYYAHKTLVATMVMKGIKTVPALQYYCNQDGSYYSQQCLGVKCSCVNKFNKNCITDGSLGCECFRDMLTYSEFEQNYANLVSSTQKGTYNHTQYFTGNGASYIVDAEGFRVSPVTRTACKINEESMAKCQIFGNEPNTALPDEGSYCDTVCETCVSESYLYQEDYFISAECDDMDPLSKK